MKIKLPFLIILLLLTVSVLKAQNVGDYQSPGGAAGVVVDLGSATNWKIYNGTAWVNATAAPGLSPGLASGTTITVQDPDIWQNATATTTVVATGTTLIIKSNASLGTFTSNKLNIKGTLAYAGTAPQFIPAGGSFLSTTMVNLTIDNPTTVSTTSTSFGITGLINLIQGQFYCNTGGGNIFYSGTMASSGGLINCTGAFKTTANNNSIINGNYFVNNIVTIVLPTYTFSTVGPIVIPTTAGAALDLSGTNRPIINLGGPLSIGCSAASTTSSGTAGGGINAGDNMVTFNGIVAQKISTNLFLNNTVNNLTINNAAGVKSSSAFTIAKSLTVVGLGTTTPLIVTGTGTLSGTLAINSFAAAPTIGQQYTIVSGTSLSGTFSGVTLPAEYTGTLAYTSTAAILTVYPSSDATLSSMVLSAATLSPTFVSGTTSYTASVPYATSSITVKPTTNDANATVKVNGIAVASGAASGSIPLNPGNNIITTVVTAFDGVTTNTYTVNVTRIPLSTDATLSNMVLSGGTLSPVFNGATTSYNVSVPNTTTSITVTPTTNDATATLTLNGTSQSSGSASAAIPLSLGNNTITVVVTAQDGTTTKTYTTTVTRVASTDASLAGLTISSGTLNPVFSSLTTAYTVSVANSVTSLTVTPTVNDATATVTVNNVAVTSGSSSGSIALTVGSNTITTIVSAQDGTTTQTYTITVTRAASSNADLSNFTISAGTLTPAFASATTTYEAGVSIGTASITVTPTLADATASVTVNGTSVSNGSASGAITINIGSNTITTVVTAQNGSTKTYTLTVTKTALSTNATLSGLFLSTGTLSPAFASGTTAYTSSVSNAATSIMVTPTVADATATVTVNGTTVNSGTASGAISLNVGSNTINTVVTAQDGITKQTYTVTVTRAPSSNANLNTFVLSAGTLSPVFAPGTTTYTASVGNGISSVTVTPTVADATATVTVNGTAVNSGTASSAITLNIGSNTITTIAKAQDGTLKTYTVTITRAPSTNANLTSLAISSGTLSPAFASGTNAYSVSVTSGIASVTVTPTLSDATATVKVNGVSVTNGTASDAQPLVVGNNSINVEVTASDGITINTYVITVNRPGITQTITFAPLSNVSYGIADYSPGATSTNNTIPVTYTSSNTAVATITPGGNIHVVGVGSTNITVSQSGNSSYNAAISVQQTLAVTPAALTITATNATKVYGAALPTLTASYTGLVNGDTQASLTNQPTLTTTATTSSVVGSYPITASGAASANYTISYVAGNLIVTTAPLTITATNATTVYGSAAPVLTATYTGFVNGDNAAKLTTQPALVTTYTSTSAVGTYPITVNGAASANYSISYVAATLSVTPAPLTITVNNQSRNYGIANPAFTATYAGFVNGDTPASLTTSPTITTTATITSLPGTYAITASNATGSNYTVSYNQGTLTVLPLTVATLSNLNVSTGALTPSFTTSTTSYSTTVANAVTSTSITATATDVTATIKVNGVNISSGAAYAGIPLATGANIISIVVTAQDGITSVTYTVTITRAPSSNANLSYLAVNGGNLSPTFVPANTVYTVTVPYTVGTVTLTPTLGDINATMTINGLSTNNNLAIPVLLSTGDNKVALVVTAQDGNTKNTYTITIHRAASPEAIIASNIISPNGDGKNDSWVIKDILSYPNNKVTVYDRAGRMVYTQKRYSNTWTGTINGSPLAEGTYYYVIDLGVDNASLLKGFITILRNR